MTDYYDQYNFPEESVLTQSFISVGRGMQISVQHLSQQQQHKHNTTSETRALDTRQRSWLATCTCRLGSSTPFAWCCCCCCCCLASSPRRQSVSYCLPFVVDGREFLTCPILGLLNRSVDGDRIGSSTSHSSNSRVIALERQLKVNRPIIPVQMNLFSENKKCQCLLRFSGP